MFKRNPALKGLHFWRRYKTKIAATVVAIAVWFLIVTGGTFDYVATIPIDIPRTHENLIITNSIPESAKIRLRGQGMTILAYILFREGRLQSNFHWQEGKKVIHPTKDDVVLTGSAKDLTLLELLEPDSIPLEIEELTVKQVPIRSQVTLRPHAGYTVVGETILEPSTVPIKGPKSLVDNCDSVLTVADSWQELRHPLRNPIELLPPESDQVVLLTQKIWLSADVQKLMEKKVVGVPVSVANLPANVNALVIPSHLSLVVEGGVRVVSSITERDITAYIDLQRYPKNNSHDYFAYIEPLPEIRFRDIEPKRFKVVFEKE